MLRIKRQETKRISRANKKKRLYTNTSIDKAPLQYEYDENRWK